MEQFEKYKEIAADINSGREQEARDKVILALEDFVVSKKKRPRILEHLVRQVGLYPYMSKNTSNWQDRYLLAAFTEKVSDSHSQVMHREQARLLNTLLTGESLAVSAPTSFGKSFIIDAFIAIKKPKLVAIFVPTISLMDETRRRLYKKFHPEYQIITTIDQELADKSILVFPQERAVAYSEKISSIDLLVVDEFYKASHLFDKERSHTLVQAILLFEKKSAQRYYLAPNIASLSENPLTHGMRFEKINFNTVFTKITNLYREGMSEEEKFSSISGVLDEAGSKTLIYAGTYTNIDFISKMICKSPASNDQKLLSDFSDWLKSVYGKDYSLADLVIRKTGVHNGHLHRSIGQIQLKLFDESEGGLKNIISTSSIIEGVNTSARNVIIWTKKNGQRPISSFTYKNIVGRGGRMFRHFVGNIYLLDEMPADEQTVLKLSVEPADLHNLPETADTNISKLENIDKDTEAYRREMLGIVGGESNYSRLLEEGGLLQLRSDKIKSMAADMKKLNASGTSRWKSLKMLNTDDIDTWDSALFLGMQYAGSLGTTKTILVEFIKLLVDNWKDPFPRTIAKAQRIGIGIEKFFELEKVATYKIASSLTTANSLIKFTRPDLGVDISAFTLRLSCAFLPYKVFHLEEYGMPRSVSRKIHDSGIYDFQSEGDVGSCIQDLKKIGMDSILRGMKDKHDFEEYILRYFFDGISSSG